jgi:hypothetical protein
MHTTIVSRPASCSEAGPASDIQTKSRVLLAWIWSINPFSPLRALLSALSILKQIRLFPLRFDRDTARVKLIMTAMHRNNSNNDEQGLAFSTLCKGRTLVHISSHPFT